MPSNEPARVRAALKLWVIVPMLTVAVFVVPATPQGHEGPPIGKPKEPAAAKGRLTL